ncbi:MAG: DeoR/GlpR family DNA-binding transcription regulator [Bacillaceae bacterium]
MLTEQRQQFIIQLLKERGFIKLQDVIDLTNASESTVRRDFVQLENEKKLKRVHGGATLVQGMTEEKDYTEKQQTNVGSKLQIAKYAASLIEDGDCIYLDAGTTTYEMIQFMEEKDITIVTNGLMHVEKLLNKNFPVYVTGGNVKHKTRALIGRAAIESLKTYRFNKCFLGTNGAHPLYGYTTPDPEEALIKQTAASLSLQTFVLVDETKMEEVTFSKFLEIDEGIMVTNELDDSKLKMFKEKTKVKVVTT